MPGIFPELLAGGLVVRTQIGDPVAQPDVERAYVPSFTYTMTCDLTALPSDCTARIEPKQINAIVSELVALAECMDPDGPWQCTSLNNLCAAFTQWSTTAIYTKAEADAKFVDAAGDTMTGPLIVPELTVTLDAQIPTAAPGDASNAAASTAFVMGAVGAVAGTVPVPATNVPLIDGVAAIGASAKYAREDHVHPAGVAGAVLYNTVQALSAAERQVARANIYAAPFDAMAFNGMQVNGNMEVSQELGVAGRATNGYCHDSWQFYNNAIGLVASMGQVIDPTKFPGHGYYLRMGINTPLPVLAASDIAGARQLIEGYRVARLNWGFVGAQPITIGFWSAHARSGGPYCLAIQNGAGTRSYVATYNQVGPSVPQWNTITIPGDTVGTQASWPKLQQTGMTLTFVAGAGTTWHAPSPNAWHAGNFLSIVGLPAGIASAADVFAITGVVVLPGTEAPNADRAPFIQRAIDLEEVICQRYYEQAIDINNAGNWVAIANGYAFSATGGQFVLPFLSKKRVSPTLHAPIPGDFAVTAAGGSAVTVTAMTLSNIDGSRASLGFSVASGLVAGNATVVMRNNLQPAKLAFDARLL